MHHIWVYCIIHTAFNFTAANGSPAAGPTTADISAADTVLPAHATTDVVAYPAADAATSSTADVSNQSNSKCSHLTNNNCLEQLCLKPYNQLI